MKNIKTSYLSNNFKISTIKSLIENDKKSGVIFISQNQTSLDTIEAIASLNRRDIICFDKNRENCPNYNILYGEENDVIEKLVYLFRKSIQENSSLRYINEELLINSLKILKRFKGNNATLLDLRVLILNPNGEGRLFVNKFMKFPAKNEIEQKDNLDCASYFLDNYFYEKSKTYEKCILLKNYIDTLVKENNENNKNNLNFKKIITDKKIILIKFSENLPYEAFLMDIHKSCKEEENINSNYLIVDDVNCDIFCNLKAISYEEELYILNEKIKLKSNKKIINKEEKHSFGEIMRMNRVLSGLSQTELAKELGVSASFIGCVERDEKSLSLENLINFCKIFDLSLDELFLN